MRKIHLFVVLTSVLSIQVAFADDAAMSESKPCKAIAQACLKAGYSRKESYDRKFWFDCMKPVILGKTVKGVKVDANTVKSCRSDKITELKQELNEFESTSS